MEQGLQLAGAVLILVAFVAAQRGVMSQYSRPYLAINVAGSAALAVVAALGSQWGFLLLETVWGLVSLWSLVQVMRGRIPAAAH